MKKILFILLVFCGVHANAQKVKAEVIELDTLTTTERNALTVPLGKVQIVYDETIGNFYGNVKNGGWATLASVLGALTSSDIGVTVQGYNANTDTDSTDDFLIDGSRSMTGALNMGGNNITAVGTFNLRGTSSDGHGLAIARSNSITQIYDTNSWNALTTGMLTIDPSTGDGEYIGDFNIDGTFTVGGSPVGGGSSPPFDDNSPHIRDNVDNSKTVTIVADNITTATNRNLTMPDADVDLGALTASNLADNSVGTSEIAAGAVTPAELQDLAVTSDKINTAAVTNAKILDGQISESKLNISNAPTDNYFLTYNAAGTNFSWEERIEDAAFGAGWDGDTSNAPSQNAVYDEMIKKLNSVTTGEPAGFQPFSNAGSISREDYAAGTPVTGTFYAITNPVTPEVIQIACSDLTTDVTTGTSKAYFRMPWAATLTDVRVSLLTAGTSTGLTVDINESGTTVLSTKLTTDATEKTSETATTAAVISDSALADDAEITIDFDAVPTGGQGVIVTLYVEY